MSLTYTHRPGGTANCPQCQEPISKLAKVCPHCQSDLTKIEEWQTKQNAAGCAALVVLSLSLVSAGYCVARLIA